MNVLIIFIWTGVSNALLVSGQAVSTPRCGEMEKVYDERYQELIREVFSTKFDVPVPDITTHILLAQENVRKRTAGFSEVEIIELLGNLYLFVHDSSNFPGRTEEDGIGIGFAWACFLSVFPVETRLKSYVPIMNCVVANEIPFQVASGHFAFYLYTCTFDKQTNEYSETYDLVSSINLLRSVYKVETYAPVLLDLVQAFDDTEALGLIVGSFPEFSKIREVASIGPEAKSGTANFTKLQDCLDKADCRKIVKDELASIAMREDGVLRKSATSLQGKLKLIMEEN